MAGPKQAQPPPDMKIEPAYSAAAGGIFTVNVFAIQR